MKFKEFINILFIVFFFPSLVFGVAFSNMVIISFTIWTCIVKFHEVQNIILKNKNIIFIFLIFYFFLLLSSILSNYPINSLASSLFYFLYFLYGAALLILIKEKPINQLFFLSFGLITFLFISVDAIYEIINKKNILGFSSIDGRIAGLFGDRWVIGSYLVRIMPVLIGIFFINFNLIKDYFKVFYFIIFFLSSVIIIFSGERTAYILFILYIISLLGFFLKKTSVKKILLGLFFVIFFLIFPFLFTDYEERLMHNIYFNITSFDYDNNQYLSLFTTAFKMFLENPLIGLGPNNFRLACSEPIFNISVYSCSTHPHNILLQLLSEIGLVGTILVYLFFISIIFKAFKELSKSKFYIEDLGLFSIKMGIIINLWPFITSGNFFLSWNGFIYYLPISFYFIYKKKNIKTTK